MNKMITANIPARSVKGQTKTFTYPAIDPTIKSYLDRVISRGGRIQIVSGEGDIGTVEPYAGELSVTAIAARLSAERGAGDRWSYALIETLDEAMADGYAVRWDGAEMLDQGLIGLVNDDA